MEGSKPIYRRYKKSRSTAHPAAACATDVGDRLNRLVSRSSIASSLPSLSSLHSTSSSSMPSARVADGSSTASLPSLKSVPSQREFKDFKVKTDEELQQDEARYRVLIARKEHLESLLAERIASLRDVCMQEGELSGEMPAEMSVCLRPGEDQPRLKRRVGTAFQLSHDFLHDSKADALSQLESDVELHKKIVAAADRLAKDKNMNKSVRKKRQKDLVAAASRLRGMELQLAQMRFSASKPDVSTADNHQHTWSGGASPASSRAVAKSCPVTPRGSVPDLRDNEEREDEVSEYDFDTVDVLQKTSVQVPRRPNSSASTRLPAAGANRYSEASTCSVHSMSHSSLTNQSLNQGGNSPQGLPPKSATSTGWRNGMSKSHTHGDSLDNPLIPPQQLHLYENVGYRSCASYQSAYRQVHYPTLQEQHAVRQRAKSEHSLNNDQTEKDVWLRQNERHKVPPNASGNIVDDDDELTPVGEVRADPRPRGTFTSTMGTMPNCGKPSATRARMPYSQSCSAGFSTASLDRRATKNRSPSAMSSPLVDGHLRRESVPMARHHQNQSRDCSPATHRITTFPVGTRGVFYETTKACDAVPRRTSASQLQGVARFQPERFPTTHSAPSFPPFQQMPTSFTTHNMSSASARTAMPAQSDAHMEALLDYYKERARKQHKQATIV